MVSARVCVKYVPLWIRHPKLKDCQVFLDWRSTKVKSFKTLFLFYMQPWLKATVNGSYQLGPLIALTSVGRRLQYNDIVSLGHNNLAHMYTVSQKNIPDVLAITHKSLVGF